MLTNRDRRRFERVAAREMRPARRASVIAMLGRLSTRALLVGLTVVAVAVGLGGFYASRSAFEPRTADLALGGRPAAAPEPVQEAQAPRTTDTQQANPADARQATATDARQVHLRQLQPVLRTDADRMSQVARRVRAEGRATDIRKERSDNASELRSLFTSHRVLSADLQNHFQEYSEAKESLRKSIAEQEEEFQQTIQLVMTKLSLPTGAEPRRPEVAWALLEKCLARGPGMTLTTRPDGYQYTVRGRTQRYTGGAAVAEDEGAAFAAFTSFTPEPDVVAHCDSMKKRAVGIVANAEKLSADALVLAGQPTLSGECKYTKPD
jgi:hypothetical protein